MWLSHLFILLSFCEFLSFAGAASISSCKTKRSYFQDGSIPDYVIKYAPAVHLYSEERYLPYSIEKYASHFTIQDAQRRNISSTGQVVDSGERLTLPMLAEYANNTQSQDLYMTALDEFVTNPDWLTGKDSIPEIENGRLKDAPVILIVVDKGHGIVDAFWFFFYSFNLGPFVMGDGPFGNHIGDWEHTLVRFKKGKPILEWMSAHGGGAAYTFEAMEKLPWDENRPVIFSARGTHAQYASVGQHSHDLPYHILSDFTDRGPLWDPSKNYLAYTYNGTHVLPANGSHSGREEKYGGWLNFAGHWGDQKLLPNDPRQRFHPFEWKYIDGPTGPLFKNLMRTNPCQRSKWWNFMGSCRIRSKVNMGEGVDSEGGSCALLFNNVQPYLLQMILRLLTWNGGFCVVVDRLFG